MENKNYINGLQNCSSNLMNFVTMVNSEGFAANGGGPYITPCQIWEIIRWVLVGCPPCDSGWITGPSALSLESMGITSSGFNGILDELCEELKDLLESGDVKNCDLKEQLKRALDLCKCLSASIKAINCIDDAEHLVGRLFCLLVQIILLIIAIIVKILVLLGVCNDCNCSGNTVASSFCKCLICDLKEELDQIQKLIEELNDLAIAFIRFSMKKCMPHHDKHDDDKWDDDKCNCGCKKHDSDKWNDGCKKHNPWNWNDGCKKHDGWNCKKDPRCRF